jgi:glycerophosphoryl diester phosphodiesterase
VTADALRAISVYADGIGVEKRLILPVDKNGRLRQPTDLVARARALGLFIHVWTLRADREYLPSGYNGDAGAEFEQFRALGVDGVFTDFPDLAVRVYQARTGPAALLREPR